MIRLFVFLDKAQCTKFNNDFENFSVKLEEYIKFFDVQINEKEVLINLLLQSEIFYDAQYKDAKIVANVTKIIY